MPLAADREGAGAAGSLVQLNLGGTAPDKAGKDRASALVPLRELLRRDSVGVAAGVEAGNERRALGSAAANVVRPADKRAVLVVVELDVGASAEGDALLELL